MARTEVVDHVLIRKAAQLIFSGYNQKTAAEALGITEAQMGYLKKKPAFNEEMDKLADTAGDVAARVYARALVPLMKKAMAVIDAKLDDGSLEAAVTVLKTAGLLDKNRERGQDASVNIILPGASRPHSALQPPDSPRPFSGRDGERLSNSLPNDVHITLPERDPGPPSPPGDEEGSGTDHSLPGAV